MRQAWGLGNPSRSWNPQSLERNKCRQRERPAEAVSWRSLCAWQRPTQYVEGFLCRQTEPKEDLSKTWCILIGCGVWGVWKMQVRDNKNVSWSIWKGKQDTQGRFTAAGSIRFQSWRVVIKGMRWALEWTSFFFFFLTLWTSWSKSQLLRLPLLPPQHVPEHMLIKATQEGGLT